MTNEVAPPRRRLPLVPSPAAPGPAGPERPALRQRFRVRGARTRLLLAYVLLLALSLLATVFVVRGVLLSAVEQRVEQGLRQEAQELERLVGGNDPDTGRPFGDDVRGIFDTYFRRNVPDPTEGLYSFVDGQPYLTNARPPAPLTEDPRFVARVRGLREPLRAATTSSAGPVEYLAVPVRRIDPAGGAPRVLGVFVVAEFPQPRLDAVDENVTRIGLALLTVLGLASAAAYLVAGRVLAPLREAVDTARAIQEDDLSRRIPVRGNDEIAELGRTFNAMLDRIQASLQAQRDLVSDAGHELRTPITIVRGHLELMTDDPADREQTLALVTDELGRMTRLVDDLLVLAKSERPDFLDRHDVAVRGLVQDVLAKVQALGDRAWTLDALPHGEVVLAADGQRLTQALTQLAVNAVQHTRPGDVVALGAAAAPAEVRLWVRDTGEGVAEADRTRVFDRFARAAASKRRSEGSGLGLSIVRAIAEAHGGRVELASRPGEGALFTLVLPR